MKIRNIKKPHKKNQFPNLRVLQEFNRKFSYKTNYSNMQDDDNFTKANLLITIIKQEWKT